MCWPGLVYIPAVLYFWVRQVISVFIEGWGTLPKIIHEGQTLSGSYSLIVLCSKSFISMLNIMVLRLVTRHVYEFHFHACSLTVLIEVNPSIYK